MKLNFSSQLIPSDSVLVAGISGGPDSQCLLHLLHSECGLTDSVVVAHFNHKLRPEADTEQALVRSIAKRLGMKFVTESSNVADFAHSSGLSIEEAARKLRYRFLFSQARKYAASAVVVAHTADDQVETILMHILRGSGLKGLSGMREKSLLSEFDADIPLIRPLLQIWRDDVEVYCRTHDLQPVYDASNQDQTYLRNRLRLSLIPEMETYNPRFKQALLRMAQIMANDDEILDSLVEALWLKTLKEKTKDYVAFHWSAWTELHVGIRRRLLNRAIQLLKSGVCETGFDVLDRAASIDRVGCVDLTGGLYAHVEGETLYIAGWQVDLPSAQWPQVEGEVLLGMNERTDLCCGWSISTTRLPNVPSLACVAGQGDEMQAWLDADLIDSRVKIRPRRTGERFQPLGMGGRSMKIADFFINVKIPRRARQKWPLICVQDTIAWVPGFRLAHPFRITGQTRRAVHIVLEKKG